MVRQMFDMQHGTRTGSWSELMKRVVGPMAPDDMLAVAAYVASRAP
jgi:cytochrome c553